MVVYTVGTFDLLHVGHLALLEYCSSLGGKAVKADIFVVGEDWGKQAHNLAVEAYLKAEGKQIIQVLYNPRTSSTKIKKIVLAQPHQYSHIAQAAG